jgi:hypothetical protein
MAILKGSPIFHFRFSPKERERGAHRVPLAVSSSTDATPIFVQFSSLLGDQLRSLFGEFCSGYQEAVYVQGNDQG